jgi:hypothetical protein
MATGGEYDSMQNVGYPEPHHQWDAVSGLGLAAALLFATCLFIPSVSVTLTRNQNVVPRELRMSDHSSLFVGGSCTSPAPYQFPRSKRIIIIIIIRTHKSTVIV